jgi:MYXO-CTERM domain-containing protein
MRHVLTPWAICAALSVGLFAPTAQAALIYDLSTDFGSGQIEFATLSGNNRSDVVSFTFTVEAGFGAGPITYTKSDIDPAGQTVVWSIAPDGSVTSFRLNTNPDGATTYLEFNTAGLVFDICDLRTVNRQALNCRFSPFATTNSDLWITAVAMPAPAGIALFGLAVAGLARARRRRHRPDQHSK